SASTPRSARSARRTSTSAASASTTRSAPCSTASAWQASSRETSSATSRTAASSTPPPTASAPPPSGSGTRSRDCSRPCCDGSPGSATDRDRAAPEAGRTVPSVCRIALGASGVPFGPRANPWRDVLIPGRGAQRVELERLLAGVDQVVAGAGGDERGEVVLDGVAVAVDHDRALAFLDAEELV